MCSLLAKNPALDLGGLALNLGKGPVKLFGASFLHL